MYDLSKENQTFLRMNVSLSRNFHLNISDNPSIKWTKETTKTRQIQYHNLLSSYKHIKINISTYLELSFLVYTKMEKESLTMYEIRCIYKEYG
jgi:hypothetical protein